MAKAQPKETEVVIPVLDVATPEASLETVVVNPSVDTPAPEVTVDETIVIPEVTPEAPVAVEVLMEGVKSGSTYTLPNGTVVTNH